MSETFSPVFPLPVMGGFVISEANAMRSRTWGVVPLGNGIIAAGTPLKGPATAYLPCSVSGDAALITGILLYTINTITSQQEVAVIARDAEVNEAKLVYGGMVPGAVALRLANLGIIVRRAVLDGPGGTYANDRLTDPALTNSIYGPQGNKAAQPGYVPTVTGASSYVTNPEQLDTFVFNDAGVGGTVSPDLDTKDSTALPLGASVTGGGSPT